MSCIYEDTKRRFLREGREEGRIEGRIEGKEESIADTILSLMEKMNIPMEEAFDLIDVPEEDRIPIRKRIELDRSSICDPKSGSQ